jgi:flagellar motor switch protein FliG
MASNSSNSGDSGKKNFDGLKAVAELLNFMDPESREKLLTNLSRSNPEVAHNIKKKMGGFEELLHWDGSRLQLLLREIPPDQLRLALRTASEELTDKILAHMNTRAAALLRDDLEHQGPQRQSIIANAQAEIMKTASQMILGKK